MKTALLILAFAAVASAQQAHYKLVPGTGYQGIDCFATTLDGLPTCGPPIYLPDPAVTPGAIRTSDAKQVCGISTKKFRHTTAAMKAEAYKEYGATKKAGTCCEVDHLIPLELGGLDDVKNLWPQPYLPKPAAHEKDEVENYLAKQVCAGKRNLADAQKAISTNWLAVYVEMKTVGR
jgi:hypothetical protein